MVLNASNYLTVDPELRTNLHVAWSTISTYNSFRSSADEKLQVYAAKWLFENNERLVQLIGKVMAGAGEYTPFDKKLAFQFREVWRSYFTDTTNFLLEYNGKKS